VKKDKELLIIWTVGKRKVYVVKVGVKKEVDTIGKKGTFHNKI